MNFGESASIVRDIPSSCLLKMAKVEYQKNVSFVEAYDTPKASLSFFKVDFMRFPKPSSVVFFTVFGCWRTGTHCSLAFTGP